MSGYDPRFSRRDYLKHVELDPPEPPTPGLFLQGRHILEK